MHLEVAVSNIEAALVAAKAGAHRIELCDNLGEGGTTPSYGTILYATQNINIPVYPIIRPRGGDFLYTKAEIEVINNDVAICKELGCKGVVVGMLESNGSIDLANLKKIISTAGNMQITFHRAFDRCNDAKLAMQQLIDCGVHTILTSGQRANALDGINVLKELVELAENKITIMPGAGVRAKNLKELIAVTKAIYYHTSAGTVASSNMGFLNANIDSKPSNYLHTNALEIQEMLQILQQ